MRQGWRNIWEGGKGQLRREKGRGAGSFRVGGNPKAVGLHGHRHSSVPQEGASPDHYKALEL